MIIMNFSKANEEKLEICVDEIEEKLRVVERCEYTLNRKEHYGRV